MVLNYNRQTKKIQHRLSNNLLLWSLHMLFRLTLRTSRPMILKLIISPLVLFAWDFSSLRTIFGQSYLVKIKNPSNLKTFSFKLSQIPLSEHLSLSWLSDRKQAACSARKKSRETKIKWSNEISKFRQIRKLANYFRTVFISLERLQTYRSKFREK